MSAADIGPTTKAERIGSLDVLRGVAVCGILMMTIPIMGMTGEEGRPRYPAAVDLTYGSLKPLAPVGQVG